MVEGYKRKKKNHMNELLFLAWHIEAFAKQNKLPPLESLLFKEDSEQKTKQQTPDEMIAVCRLINSALGGEEIAI